MKQFGGDFVEDVKIDKLKLDAECEVQGGMYYHYAQQRALAIAEADEAADKLKALEAEKELYYRRNPPADLKVTESVIAALVMDDTDIQAQREVVRRTKHAVDTLYAITTALDHRKSALDNLTKLQVSAYYSANPSADSQRIRM
jgi:1,2-phenylacetyl-CoA epoxidase PaaB subunit